jgi:hypothetical protein
MADFETLKTVKYWTQRCIPLVYDNSLSIYQLLEKVINELNKLITNNNMLPEYIANMIKEYISSGAIEQVVREILANYILNVKYPPSGITPAVGDGSQDDTAAVQGCIDYASARGGGAVYLPYGAYSVQSLTLKSNVSLFGFDRYTTRLVLRGGATNPLILLNGSDAGIYNLTLDGNAGIQVNDINVISMIAQNVLLNNLIIEDGYQLLVYNGTGGHLQINDVVFGNAVYRAAGISGNSIVQANGLKFNQISAVSGVDVINISSDGGTYNFISDVPCETCLSISGNDNYVTGIENGATNTFVDTGLRNTIDFKGNEKQEYYYGNTDTSIVGNKNTEVGGNIDTKLSGKLGLYRKNLPDYTNDITPTEMYFNDSYLRIYDDNQTDNPAVIIQAIRNYNYPIQQSHTIDGICVDSLASGVGTHVGILSQQRGTNLSGNVIGMAGFASAEQYAGDGSIITGLWAYSETPTYDNIIEDVNTSVVGLEVNLKLNTPDLGDLNYLSGFYSSAGVFINNYRDANTGRQNINFGIALSGTPVDGNYSSPDISNWNCFHTGILIDKVLNYGIKFGQYADNDCVLIGVPSTFVSISEKQPEVTAISLGNSKINMGNYMGSGKDNDLWCNSGNLWFKPGSENPVQIALNYHDITIDGHQINFSNVAVETLNNSLFVFNNNLSFKDNTGITHSVVLDNQYIYVNENGVSPIKNNTQALGNPDLYYLSAYVGTRVKPKNSLMEAVASKFSVDIAGTDIDFDTFILNCLNKCAVQA